MNWLNAGNYISIHAPREGGDHLISKSMLSRGISIHAPREGGDVFFMSNTNHQKISIHAPREGGDDIILCYGIM